MLPIFSDAPQHAPYRVGKLSDYNSIFEAYATAKLAGWRRSLLTYGPKNEPRSTCLDQRNGFPGTPADIAEREALARALLAGTPTSRSEQMDRVVAL